VIPIALKPFAWLRNLWYLLEYGLSRVVLRVMGVIPVRLALGVAEVVTRFCFLVMRERRRVALDNIRRAGITEDPKEVRRLALAAFRSVIVTVVEAIIVGQRMTPDNWSEFVKMDLPPELDRLIREPGKGVIVATGHLGNWEVVARATSMIKPLCAIYRPFKNPYMDKALQSDRGGTNLRLVTKYADDPLRFIRTLKDGEVLAIMIDQHARGGIKVEFFGRPAKTTPSVALLHLLTSTPIVVGNAVRTGPLRYEVHVTGPFTFERSGDKEHDVFEITQRMTREIEAMVRRFPGQYMWGHRRWK